MPLEDVLASMGVEATMSNLAVALCAQYTQLQLHTARLRAALAVVSTISMHYGYYLFITLSYVTRPVACMLLEPVCLYNWLQCGFCIVTAAYCYNQQL
jgi:hypothetical protein